MDTTTRIVPFLFLFFLFTTSSAMENCPNSFCSRTEPIIRFPFRIQTRQPAPCGYPGFDLFCDAFNQTFIDLPNSGKFTVHAIDYATQNIWLNDPDNCMPRRLLGLDFSGSPFKGAFFQDFTLFNCTEFDYTGHRFDPIGCLSGANFTVVASSSERAVRFLASKCSGVATVAVPVQWGFTEPVMTSDLSDDIRLTWTEPRCGRCETRGGRCGLNSNTSSDIVCTNVPRRRSLPMSGRYALIAAAATPALLFLVGILCFICNRVTNYGGRDHPVVEFSTVVAPHPIPNTASGLDGPTIDSYPKTTVGESLRLPMPDHNICSICLCEYMPKETLRSIPECQHCFHVECIDEWLRMNGSCPVCRNSPKVIQGQ